MPKDATDQSIRGETANPKPSATPEPQPPGAANGVGNGRTERKRQAIMAAATASFLRDGYRNTSMDQIAADAEVSKQTVYKQFADKEQLFRDIVLGVTGNSEVIVTDMTSVLQHHDVTTPAQLRIVLTELARNYLDAVLQPHVLALRRLIIAEAERFPDLASAYFEQAPTRGIDIITDAIQRYIDRGLLTAEDPRLAGAHFAYLALAIAQDRALFYPHERPSRAERDRLAAEATRIFIAAYGPTQTH
ncbi:MAG: TetR/AcrR family transcriptional regulator [Actinomycetota bacterium]|nr:TetR/AcrR family transcriptional regulator [Actinomycetota bacterium]